LKPSLDLVLTLLSMIACSSTKLLNVSWWCAGATFRMM
jgi:hypothetical protein